MKPFSILAVAFAAMVLPVAVSAQSSYTMVYRPEVRSMVLVPARVEGTKPPSETPADMIARHRAMAAAYRLNPNQRALANPADHCERLIAELEKAEQARR